MTYPVSWPSLTSSKSLLSEKKKRFIRILYTLLPHTHIIYTATIMKPRGKARAQYILFRDHDNG